MNKLGRFVLELAAAAVLFAVAYLLAQAKGWNPNLAAAMADNAASPEDITPTRPLTEVPEKAEEPAAENPAANAVPAEKPEIPDENKPEGENVTAAAAAEPGETPAADAGGKSPEAKAPETPAPETPARAEPAGDQPAEQALPFDPALRLLREMDARKNQGK